MLDALHDYGVRIPIEILPTKRVNSAGCHLPVLT
jgi:hypothetical protein